MTGSPASCAADVEAVVVVRHYRMAHDELMQARGTAAELYSLQARACQSR